MSKPESVPQLLARDEELRQQMAAIDAAHAGALPEAEQQRWDALKTERAELKQKVERRAELDASERRARGTPIAGGDHRWNELLSGYSLSRALLYADATVDAARERECSQEIERRTARQSRGILVPDEIFFERRAGQEVSTGSLGGFLVGESFRPDMMIDRLRSASVLPRLQATYVDGLVGAAVIPKLTSSGTVEWIGEDAAPTESTASFGSITLTPKTAALTMSYSRRMLLNAQPSIEQLLRNDIARQAAAAIDHAAIAGSGIGSEPLGLLNAGVPTIPIATNGGQPTVPNLIDLAAAPRIADGLVAGPAWLTNNRVISQIQRITESGSGRFMFLDTLPGSLLGYPMITSSTVPNTLSKGTSHGTLSAMIFGAWSSMIVGRWSGLDILSDPFTRGAQGAVRIYAFQDVDIGVRHIESFSAFTDVAA